MRMFISRITLVLAFLAVRASLAQPIPGNVCHHDGTLVGNCTVAAPLSVIGSSGGAVVATSISDSGQLILTGSIAPTALAGSVNNYAPCDVTTPANCLATTNLVRQDASVASTVTGLAAQASGQAVALLNISATNSITLTNEDTNSTAANRFTLPNGASWVIPPGGAVLLRYSSATSRWRPEHSNNNNVMATAFANSGPETETGFINPTGLTGTLNDWAPTGFATARFVVATDTGAVTVNGIAGGAEGRIVTIIADPANANTISFNNENAGSVAGNRFQLTGASSEILSTGSVQTITFRYDATAARWREIALDSARFGRSMTFSGTSTFWGSVNNLITSVQSPAALASGSTNDYAPTTATAYRLTPASGGSTVTSLSLAQADGKIVIFTNIATADNLTLIHDDGASGTAANRFLLDNAASCVLTPNTSITIRYDGTSSRWRPITPCPNSTQNIWLGTQTDSFTTQQNDYAIGASVSRLVWTGASSTTATGFAGGADGRILLVENQSASGFALTITSESSSSAAANRISGIGASSILVAGFGSQALLMYDGAAARWRILSLSTSFVNAGTTFGNAFKLSGTLSPAALTGPTQNDYSGGGCNGVTAIRQDDTTADTTITGLSCSQASGSLMTISNISTTNNIVLTNEDTGSTAANRFLMDGANNCVLYKGSSMTLRYDSTSSRWRGITPCPSSTQTAYPNATITVTDTGTVNDYSPTGLGNASIIRLNPASALTITGIAGGTDGRQLMLCAVGAGTIGMSNEAAGSTAANRILAENNAGTTLTASANPNACALLIYDATSARWREIAYNSAQYNATHIFTGRWLANSGGKFGDQGTAPTLASCGTGASVTAGEGFFTITTGTTPGACSATFAAAFTNTPTCVISAEDGVGKAYTTSTTAVTFTSVNASQKYHIHCTDR